jgi:hypothetical protein
MSGSAHRCPQADRQKATQSGHPTGLLLLDRRTAG